MARTHSRFLAGLSAFVAAASLMAAASIQGSFERSYQVNGPVSLEVLTRSGDITVRSGPAGTVTVRGKIHVGDRWFTGDRQGDVSEIEKNPPIRQSGNEIHIDYLNYHDISVDYEITTPPDSTVQTHSGSGDQRLEGLHGSVNLESGSGDMRLRQVVGEVHIHTGSGDVEGREMSGAFTAETGSGDVRVDESGSGDVQVHTGSGTIELRGVKGALRSESGSGDVTVAGTQTGTWEVRTSSGNVDLELPQNAGFDLDARAGSGEVVVNRPITMVVQGNLEHAHHAIHGKVAGGGPELIVHTSSGDVHIN